MPAVLPRYTPDRRRRRKRFHYPRAALDYLPWRTLSDSSPGWRAFWERPFVVGATALLFLALPFAGLALFGMLFGRDRLFRHLSEIGADWVRRLLL